MSKRYVLVSVGSSRAGAFVWLAANQYSIFYKWTGFSKARKDFQPLILKGCKVVFDAIRQLLTVWVSQEALEVLVGMTRVLRFSGFWQA
jgi:hypothetical protein